MAKIRIEMGLSHDQMSHTESVVVGAQRIRARLPSDVTHICVAALLRGGVGSHDGKHAIRQTHGSCHSGSVVAHSVVWYHTV